MKQKPKHDAKWAKAKDVCRLNMEDIRMAKELGMTPKSLLRNVPNPKERWKLPVKLWIRELHEKRFGRKVSNHPDEVPNHIRERNLERDSAPSASNIADEEDLPF